jgi:basic amino acid/polyamine antiporter, APA family
VSAGAGSPQAARRSLLRVLGAREGAAVGIGVAIGAGIFRTPGYVAAFVPGPLELLGVWLLGALIVLGDALVLSELASRIPRAGGWYVYIEKGWGRFPAFIYGWVFMLIIDPASSAALVVVLGEYLQSLFGLGATAGRLLAIATALSLFGISLAGVRVGSRVQDALTYSKLLLLLAVAALAFFMPGATPPASSAVPAATGLLAIGLALQGVLWTFEGYANSTTMTEEAIEPRRALPRALIGTAVALGVTYLLVNAAYLHVLGRDGLVGSKLPAADMARKLLGQTGGEVFLVLAIFTAIGSLNGAVLSAPRVAYALSRSGSAPGALTHVSRVGTPVFATLWFAVAWTLYAWFGSFEGLISVSVFIGALANVLVTASLFRLRRRAETQSGETFLTPGYPWLPAAMLLVWGSFAFAVLYDQKWKVGYGLLVTLMAAPVYLWLRRRERPLAGS